MKKNILLILAMSTLSACSTMEAKNGNSEKLGVANPASQYCIQQGGKLEIKNESNGQVGYCYLPNGTTVEEWALFRANQGKCLAEEATKLVGKSALSETQIKQLTKSEIVRIVQLGQPVTMDYREERVTVTIDPKSNKISHASCG